MWIFIVAILFLGAVKLSSLPFFSLNIWAFPSVLNQFSVNPFGEVAWPLQWHIKDVCDIVKGQNHLCCFGPFLIFNSVCDVKTKPATNQLWETVASTEICGLAFLLHSSFFAWCVCVFILNVWFKIFFHTVCLCLEDVCMCSFVLYLTLLIRLGGLLS